MAHAVNHNLVFRRVVIDQVRIGRDDHTPQATIARKLAGIRMLKQEIDNDLNACLHVAGTLR